MHKESCAFSEARGDSMKNELLQEEFNSRYMQTQTKCNFFPFSTTSVSALPGAA